MSTETDPAQRVPSHGESILRNEIDRTAQIIAGQEGKVADLKGDLEKAQASLDMQFVRLNSLTRDLKAIKAARE